jgi:hypothetical protein
MIRFGFLMLPTLLSVPLFAGGHDLTMTPPSANQMLPVVTGNGSGFTAAWYEPALSHYTAASSVVGANGEPIDGGLTATDAPPVSSMAIAHSPSDTLLVWTAEDKLIAERLSPSGKILSTTLVTFGNGDVSNVAVVWSGSRYFVTWSRGVQLVGAFVAPDGSSTTPQMFFSEPVVSGQAQEKLLLAPDLAWDGQHFVVVFGEVLNALCSFTCPVPRPDQFRVMRLSAGGDAIDSAPLIISGTHLRAHVASSGAESLIAFDGLSDVSTIVAHTDAGLTLDAETPVFRWFAGISSDVVWDGEMFTVALRYAGADVRWLGSAHVTRSGFPIDYGVTTTGGAPPFDTVEWGRPSIAVNDAGTTAFAISEATGPSSARARLYLTSELAPMPAPPAAPRNVVSFFAGSTARIDWQSDPAPGFAIEAWSAFDNTWYTYRIVPGDTRTTTIYTSIGSLFRVRAFGPGGLSEGTITSIGSLPRSRSVRR